MTMPASQQEQRVGALHAHLCGRPPPPPAGAAPAAAAAGRRLKIAAVVTEYRKYSHAQHICDRFLMGYGWENEHHHPEGMDLVSIYIDQEAEGHLGRGRAAEYPQMTIYESVAEALCLGGGPGRNR
jgi:hypothetical protein